MSMPSREDFYDDVEAANVAEDKAKADAARLRHNYLERVAPARQQADKRGVPALVKAVRALGGEQIKTVFSGNRHADCGTPDCCGTCAGAVESVPPNEE